MSNTSKIKKSSLLAPLRMVIVGHVDHGKSTLIGRLLYDTDSLPDGKKEELEKFSQKRGMDMEWSFLLDAFQAERDQAITIDTTQIWFHTEKRNYVIIDAPGHREFLKNMISGAAQADAAVLVVDAKEGVQEQTRRHAYLLHLLGLKQIVVAINKIDMVDYDQKRFEAVSKEVKDYLKEINLEPNFIIPISARFGDGLAMPSDKLSWFKGGSTVLEALESFERTPSPVHQPLRFPIQDVYRYDEQRILVGRIESGSIKKGDTVLISPTNETATVTGIEVWPEDESVLSSKAGDSAGITLDKPVFVERGHLLSHENTAPVLSKVFAAHIFWLDEQPLEVGKTYTAKINTQSTTVRVQSIQRSINTDTLAHDKTASVGRHDMAEVILRSQDPIALDNFGDMSRTGRVVIFDGYDVVGGGGIDVSQFADMRLREQQQKSTNITAVDHLISADDRAWANNHKGAVIWLTGLSGAGKSTIAMNAERELFNRGYKTYVLDGDNVRHGLNKDLTFSPEDRAENIRRIGHVAALMADAGIIVLTAFISPYRADREIARNACDQLFQEVYINADLETCEQRDVKGLYKKARDGEIKNFTGISAPYEAPENPEITVNTIDLSIEDSVAELVDSIEKSVALETKDKKAKA